MMLQIDHRESYDVDIFLTDAQLLPFLDPKLRDFEFEIRPSDYGGDGARFLKLAFEGIGEIDFIVAQAITDHPTTKRTVAGETVDLETVSKLLPRSSTIAGRPSSRVTSLTSRLQHNKIATVSSAR